MLRIQRVSRSFGPLTALDQISFDVNPGRLTGFVGANGAGKTTAMRIVMGVLTADAGAVHWQGEEPDLAVRRRFGYMPEERGLYPKMTVRDQIVYFARLHGTGAADAGRRTGELLDRLGLADRADDRLETLSLGNQQRAQLAAALVHDPVLLLLDEPFSGLDPVAVDTTAELLRERAAAGVPVLFSSHQLGVVESLCDDLVVLDGGRVRAAGAAEQLRQAHAGARFRLRLGEDAGWLRDEPELEVLDVDGSRALVQLPDVDQDQKLLHRLLERGAVHEFSRVLPTLAEIFREVVR